MRFALGENGNSQVTQADEFHEEHVSNEALFPILLW